MRTQYNVKIDDADIRLMQKITKIQGNDVSDFIRLAIKKELASLGFLGRSDIKALGVSV